MIKIWLLFPLGAIKVLRNTDGGGGVQFSGKKLYEGSKVQCY